MRQNQKQHMGVGQLTLVEHALCPLDNRASLCENFRHVCQYRYSDGDGSSQTARVAVQCPLGLSSGDEFYLWGLLALTFAQAEPRCEFQATPHFCLRKLGLISAASKGGKTYRLFRDALRRLSAVCYQNESFFDPIRREHRAVSFGLLSYSLPLEPDSSRRGGSSGIRCFSSSARRPPANCVSIWRRTAHWITPAAGFFCF